MPLVSLSASATEAGTTGNELSTELLVTTEPARVTSSVSSSMSSSTGRNWSVADPLVCPAAMTTSNTPKAWKSVGSAEEAGSSNCTLTVVSSVNGTNVRDVPAGGFGVEGRGHRNVLAGGRLGDGASWSYSVPRSGPAGPRRGSTRSSSTIVTLAVVGVARVAQLGLGLRMCPVIRTRKSSGSSTSLSSINATVKVCSSSPGARATVIVGSTKSAPARAPRTPGSEADVIAEELPRGVVQPHCELHRAGVLHHRPFPGPMERCHRSVVQATEIQNDYPANPLVRCNLHAVGRLKDDLEPLSTFEQPVLEDVEANGRLGLVRPEGDDARCG